MYNVVIREVSRLVPDVIGRNTPYMLYYVHLIGNNFNFSSFEEITLFTLCFRALFDGPAYNIGVIPLEME